MAKNYYPSLAIGNIFLVLVVFIFFVPQPSFAQMKSGIEVQPSYVDVDLRAEEGQEEITISYTNHSQNSIILELYPMDFRSTNPSGGIGFVGQNVEEYSYSLSSFLSFETNRLDLEPGETKTLQIAARNRQDLTPGGHYAAVIARQLQEDSSQTIVSPAVSSLIFLRKIGGESYNLSLKEMSWPRTVSFSYPPTITLLFQNEGNTHLTPTGRMEVKDIFGRLLFAGNLNEGFVKVLPESQRFIPVYLRQVSPNFPLSINTLTLRGTDSFKKVTFQRTDVFVYIHPLVLLILLLMFGSIGIRRLRKGKVRPLSVLNSTNEQSERIDVKKKKKRRRKRK